ncbi:hypothetical protein SAMN04488591_3121 [Microbacterium azadirachtae]|uniref:Uncharacterized protein n=1 Tax=Microbacterium azadirachtae TaxID=582680 RepID=A0A1I6IYF6_9MICO|nr:hypothetical protein [Microbacterium azadirachtae]SFR71775.1 hypothetical protein SAMN04488591_3121 [Microbacterium azadirachtae]
MQITTEPKTRAWNDLRWRDRYLHIIEDDEHAADMLAEVFADIDQRHPYALCGVSLACLEPNPQRVEAEHDCPECLALLGGDDSERVKVSWRIRPHPDL